MTRPAAIQADYCNFKRVRGRRVVVLEIEVPLEREREVFDVLGFPDPAVGCPVAIAPLNLSQDVAPATERPENPRRRWSELSRAQQAGIRCNDPDFGEFLRTKGWQISGNGGAGPDDTAQAVRIECAVTSRADLDRNDTAARAWDKLDAEFQEWAGWLTEERS